MVSKRDANIIVHTDGYRDQIMEGMTWYGNSFEVLKNNHVFRDGITMILQQITELSQHLSYDFTRGHGNMPWRSIKGLSGVFSHRYQKVNYESMWNTLSVAVPELKQFCLSILALTENMTPDPPDGGPGNCGPMMG
ncbi:MAG: DUF86 domain-containing protein [Deltaproteobacteria bacterium]|jgi:uncharacterized protein with HEPN domain|nr:DUF86 domain-containing protein [Deltaproteobacteria bacterium]